MKLKKSVYGNVDWISSQCIKLINLTSKLKCSKFSMKVLAFSKSSYLKSSCNDQFIRKCLSSSNSSDRHIQHLHGFADGHIDQSWWPAAKTRYGTGPKPDGLTSVVVFLRIYLSLQKFEQSESTVFISIYIIRVIK